MLTLQTRSPCLWRFMFEDMSKIAAAAIFATRLIEVAEEGLILLDQMSKDLGEKESKFQEDNS